MKSPVLAIVAAVALMFCVRAALAGERAFPIYDNMFFTGKPDSASAGLEASNIIYGGAIWPGGLNYGVLPSRKAFDAIVAAHRKAAGPIVLDIEHLPLSGDRRTVMERLHVLATLADWTRADARGRVVGYFGYNTLTGVAPENRDCARALARHVDAFFPPMYAHGDDRAVWVRRAEDEIRENRGYAPGKPIFFYLWPQYDAHTPRQFQWIDRAYWRFQLDTSYRDADGIVLWGPGHVGWNTSSGWWTATLAFMQHVLRLAQPITTAATGE